ncbi:MAG: PQQ-binding-like beta-propeller repeat protein [Actinomycetota bacterium]|nr:PQQ-binding-like beta-propeller repeat protein [Actinomycetota bacterium]
MSYFARRGTVFVAAVAVVALLVGLLFDLASSDDETTERMSPVGEVNGSDTTAANTEGTDASSPAPTAPAGSTTTTAAPFVARTDVLVDPESFGRPYSTDVPGVLTFRGNPTRSYYGSGPVPRSQPQVLWQYPGKGNPMCGESSEYGNVRIWCGTGWTGQPAVFERDGRTWVVFGAYDWKVHFVDAATGLDIIPPFETGDLAKGNVTVDPDGFPLVYVGSRDNYLRVIAFDGSEPRELWKINGRTDDRKHNDDWDAAPLVLNDHLLEGGENSWFYGIKLNRGYAADGTVTVDPALTFRVPGWDQQLIDDLGSKDPNRVSLEASVAVSGDTAWLNSSGGLVQGWDISSLRTGQGDVQRTFRFWTGDDSDATIVPDDEGFLFVGAEVDRNNSRAQATGQLLKLDPRNPDDPVVWSIDVNNGEGSGTWAAPIVLDDVVIWNTKPGKVYGVDRTTGEILWKLSVAAPVLSSPSVVDGVLIQADGNGTVHAYDVSSPRTAPTELWSVTLDANIESTPVVWEGRIYVGTRAGYVYCLGTPG